MKETEKQKFQRIAKELGVKFKDTDTTKSIVILICNKLDISVMGKLDKSLKASIMEKISKNESDNSDVDIKVHAPDSLNQEEEEEILNAPKAEVSFPYFEDVQSMKIHCVSVGLNKVDGYILATKGKKVDFLNWMKENIDKAIAPEDEPKEANPHSPSSGIGSMESENNIEKAKSSIGDVEDNDEKTELPEKAFVNNTENIVYSTVTEETTQTDMPTAITENNKAMNYGDNGNHQKPVEKISNIETDAHKLAKMKDYATSIMFHIENSPSVRFQGGLRMDELDGLIASADKSFKYQKENDDNGMYLIISDDSDNKKRIPEVGYLPM